MIFAIADLHLPSTLGKTMDRFGSQWADHPEKLRRAWIERVGPGDSVLICGDTSWAMRPHEAIPDLEFVASLPGNKYLIRGNHDYWWARSGTRKLQATLPPGMTLLQGAGIVIEGIGVAGTRGWESESVNPSPEDSRILNRELAYLKSALRQLPPGPRVAMLHYPPYHPSLEWNEFGLLLLDAGVELAIFGHLHAGNPHVLQGRVDGIELQLVAADQVAFTPQPLALQKQ